jgi:hypothetical protein
VDYVNSLVDGSSLSLVKGADGSYAMELNLKASAEFNVQGYTGKVAPVDCR